MTSQASVGRKPLRAAKAGAEAPAGEPVRAAKPRPEAPAGKTSEARTRRVNAAASPQAPSRDTGAAPLTEGARAPSFELVDHAGQRVSSADLAGQPYVLYFYPKDDTPGCTTEACAFRDALSDFEDLGVRVIGVSPDSSASHERFRGKYALQFPLLSDPEHVLASAYGVWAMKKNYGREYMGIVRSTFLIDAEGRIRNAWRNIRVNGHIATVQAAAAELA